MPESTQSWEEVEVLSRDKTNLLVVDDEQAIAEIMAAMLTSEGYFVDTATKRRCCLRSLLPIVPEESLLISS